MSEIELDVPPGDVTSAVERIALALGLQGKALTLKQYPGSAHWHFSRPGCKGVLECTWWPATGRLWLSFHANRAAKWHDQAIYDFRRMLRMHN